jgi:ABC-type glycerol-3-phosphate transport system substrate-binding protein
VSKRKNGFILIAILLLCMLLLSQLVGDTSEQRPSEVDPLQVSGTPSELQSIRSQEQVELRVKVFMNAAEFRLLTQWNQQFEAKYPEYKVSLTNLSREQAYTSLKALDRAHILPDIMLLDNRWVTEFAANGILSPHISEYVPEDQQTKLSQTIDQVSWNGYQWAIPRDVDPYVAVFQSSLFEVDGEIIYPVNLEEWLAKKEQLLEEQEVYKGIYLDGQDPLSLLSAVWAFGEEWALSDDGMFVLQSEKQTPFIHALLHTDIPEGLVWEVFDASELPAMITPLSKWLMEAEGKGALQTKLVNKPNQTGGLWISGTSYAVSSSTPYQQDAYQWISFITSLNRQLQLIEVTGKLPAHVSTFESSEFLGLPQWDVIREAVDNARVLPSDPRLRQKLEALQSVMKDFQLNSEQPLFTWNERLIEEWSMFIAN